MSTMPIKDIFLNTFRNSSIRTKKVLKDKYIYLFAFLSAWGLFFILLSVLLNWNFVAYSGAVVLFYVSFLMFLMRHIYLSFFYVDGSMKSDGITELGRLIGICFNRFGKALRIKNLTDKLKSSSVVGMLCDFCCQKYNLLAFWLVVFVAAWACVLMFPDMRSELEVLRQ